MSSLMAGAARIGKGAMEVLGAAGGVGGAVGAGVMGADAAAFGLGDVLLPMAESLTRDEFRDEAHDVRVQREGQLTRSLRVLRLQQAMRENVRMLMEQRPDIFNQVAAGRKLPRGARVVGGQPDMEAVNRLAMMMAQGNL